MNKTLLLTALFACIMLHYTAHTQTFGCDGQFINAGVYESLCENPNGGEITLLGSSSNNVVGFVWSDANGEIARDNLQVDNYFLAETTTITLSGIVISDNEIPDGEFGSGTDFENGIPGNYQGTFFTEYALGPLQDPPLDEDGNPLSRDELPPLEVDGSYIITDNSINGGPGFVNCTDPDGFGNIAVFNLGEEMNKVICFRVNLTAGNEYTFSTQVATVGEVLFDASGDPAEGPPDGESAQNDPNGDIDGDGILNGRDCCPFVPTASETDCDPCTINGMPDSDGDGIEDSRDNCPFVANQNQNPAACSVTDRDGDGILDWQDNCPELFNPSQEDRNGDGIGDACEMDGPGGGNEEGYCIPALNFELQGNNNQNTVIGETHQSETEFCVWTDMVRTFTADVTGEVELCLRSACPYDSGNFLALDNLQFSETCRIEDQVTIFVDNISANILPVEPLDCNTEGVLLEGEWDAVFNDPNSIQFFWFEAEQNVLIDGATDEEYYVDEPGTYNFSVFNNESNCFAVFPMEVEDNFSTPEATIAFPDTISCANETVTLDATASSGGADDDSYTYEWNGVFGAEFVNGIPQANSPTQEVLGSGTYELTVTNTFNGCSSEAVIFVAENIQSVSLSAPQTEYELGCDISTVIFDATADIETGTDPSDIEYIWTQDDQVIATGSTFESPVVTESGVYTLQVINNSSGCSDELTFNVTGEVSGPEVIVPPIDESISCDNPTVDVTASLSDLTNITYAWTNSAGTNLSPNGELEVSITEPGVYTFTATDDLSGCAVVEEVTIQGNTEEPNFTIAIPTPFDCRVNEVTLEGLPTDPLGNYTYQWTDVNNNSIGDALTQTVNAAGAYRLLITDNDNGCSREVQINVFDNTADPQFNLSQDVVLNCNNDASNIQINTSENNLNYAWSTVNGSIINEAGSSITVDEPGDYSVIVTDEDTGCTSTANFNLQTDFTAPNFLANQPNEINCENASSSIFIDDFGSSYNYVWTTQNGNITSGANSANPSFDQAGDYTVSVTNPTSGCSIEQSFSVIGNSLEPEIAISGGGQLGCNDQNLPISVALINTIPSVSVAWVSNNGGTFDSQTNMSTALASAAGIYEVIVTNTDNGCTAAASIEVTQDNDRPNINLPQPSNLDCNNTTVVLDALGSDNDPNLQITWTAQNGSNISDPNSLNPSITQADTYTLTITNPSNGCETTASVTIEEDRVEPVVDLVSNAELDCDNPTLILGGALSSTGNDIQYQWLDDNMMPIPGATNQTYEVSSAGNYTLSIINTATGCENSAQVIVAGNADLPDVDAGQNIILDCSLTSTNLSGTATDNASYTWTSIDGNIVSGANTLTPEINAPGTYTLTVLVESTGCEASASVAVEEDVNIPVIEVAETVILNCNNLEIVIDASQSTANGVEVQWTSIENNPIENATSLLPTISEPGTYVLTLIDENTQCENSIEVIVDQNRDEPIVNLEPLVELDCTSPNQVIGAEENSDYSYQWNATSASITGDATNAQLEVNEPGQYELTVINNQSGCEANYVVDVTGDFVATEILSLDADVLTCVNNPVNPLLVIDTDVSEVSILWSNENGASILGANTINPTFEVSDEYTVQITNLESGCITEAAIFVEEDINPPTFDLGGLSTIDCAQNTINVGLNLIDQVPSYEYEWTDGAGNVVSNSPQYNIENDGFYTLEIFDTSNGCSFSDELEVVSNFNEPEITVSSDQTFRCGDTELTLQGSLISNLNNFAISWETENGRIESGGDTFEPTISQPGTYIMVLTNLDTECESEASVTVIPDTDAPVAIIDPVGDLTCEVSSLLLNGGGSSSQGNDLEFSWFRDGVLIESGVDQISIDMPGTYDLVVRDVDNNCSTTTSAFIDLNNADPIVSIATPEILDCDQREVILVSNFDTSEDFIFNWSNPTGAGIISDENASEILVDEPGEYTLEVIDANTGCAVSQTIEVLQDASVPEFELSTSGNLNCEDQSVNILADIPQGNFDLTWTDEATGMVIDTQVDELAITEPGIYQLEVFDIISQCSSSRTIEISENVEAAQLDALQPLAISCDNVNTQITAEIINGITDFNINWTTVNGQIGSANLNTLDLNVLSGGTYTIEVTNLESGCVSSLDIIVEENGIAPSFTVEEPSDITCDNVQVPIRISNLTTGVNQSISWSTIDGNIVGDTDTDQIVVDTEGTYLVRVENLDSGCFSEESVIIELNQDEPLLSAPLAEELNCLVIESELSIEVMGVNDFSVNWSTVNGSISGSVTDVSSIAIEEGDYTAVVTNLENGCTSEITIPVSQNIDIPVVDIDPAEVLTCKNEVVSLQGNVPSDLNVDVAWTDDNGGIISNFLSESIEVNLPGVYTLTVINLDNNCENSAEIIVEENVDIPTGIVPVVSEPFCFGDFGSVNIVEVEGGIGPYNYSIDGSAFDEVSDFDQLSPGTYNVAILDSEECLYTEEIVIPETPEIIVSTPPNIDLLVGQQNQINVTANIPETSISTITWTPATFLSCDNCLNPTVTPLNDITYNISIEDENGCVATDSIAFRVQRVVGIYAPNAFSPNGDGINDAFTIFSNEDVIEKIAELAVYDRWGNQVFLNTDFPPNDEQFGWNGTFREVSLQPNVFIYKALVTLANGENEEIKGNVSLMK